MENQTLKVSHGIVLPIFVSLHLCLICINRSFATCVVSSRVFVSSFVSCVEGSLERMAVRKAKPGVGKYWKGEKLRMFEAFPTIGSGPMK